MADEDRSLRARAAGAGNSVAKPDPIRTMSADIERMKAQFQLAMPRGAEAGQLVRDAVTALRETRNLAKCTTQSVLGGLMTCAQLGLRVGVMGQAWLIPFWDRHSQTHQAQLVIGYQGFVELGYRSDRVAAITARTVYANDPVFSIEYGTEDKITHTPITDGSNRGQPVGYYAVVHITKGRPIFFYMDHRSMEDYRDKHATNRDKQGRIQGPWVDQFESMAHKTCLRQLAKWMPRSTDLATAMTVDDGVRIDLTPERPAAETTHHYDYEGQVVSETYTDDPPSEAQP